jgi:GNAT superfamily N-acetyltransferase
MDMIADVAVTAAVDGVAVARLDGPAFDHAVPQLAQVLVDAVDGGASVGFVHPFTAADAQRWWHTVRGGIDQGSTRLWVAADADGIAGTIQLKLTVAYTNGRHRAEIAKLLVHRRARGQGIGRLLLATAEAAAAEAGVTILMLDTQTDSPAEFLYAKAGWTRFGVMPDHAADPAGVLQPTTFFYKKL